MKIFYNTMILLSVFGLLQADADFLSNKRILGMAECGNGSIEGLEQCDDGNTEDGDGCSYDCMIEDGWDCEGLFTSICSKHCGNGQLDGSEQCDDGNVFNNDGCSSDCQIEGGWECQGTPSRCTQNFSNQQNGMASNQDLLDEPPMGETESTNESKPWFEETETGPESQEGANQGVEPEFPPMDEPSGQTSNEAKPWYEENESGPDSSTSIPLEDPSESSSMEADQDTFENCGDGKVSRSEQCDDGNVFNNDGCSSDCQIESGWQCYEQHGQSSECVREGSAQNNAQFQPQEVEGMEEEGAGEPENMESRCGDGSKSLFEDCDDGNTLNGDGCSSTCEIEQGWNCESIDHGTSFCVEEGNQQQPEDISDVDGGVQPEFDVGSPSSQQEDDEWPQVEENNGVETADVGGVGVEGIGSGQNWPSTEVDPADLGEVEGIGSGQDWPSTDSGPSPTNMEVNEPEPTATPWYLEDEETGPSNNGVEPESMNEIMNETPDQTGPPDQAGNSNGSVCGDGVRTEGEACDDGNINNGDGCDSNCEVELGWTCQLDRPSICIRN